MPLSKLLAIAAATLLLGFFPAMVSAAPDDLLRRERYLESTVLRVEKMTSAGFELVVCNDADPNAEAPMHASKLAMVAAPRGSHLLVAPIDGTWDAHPEGGPAELGIDIRKTSSSANLPQTAITPRVASIDDFRSVGMVRLDIPIVVQAATLPKATNPRPVRAIVREARFRIQFRDGETAAPPSPEPGALATLDPYLLDVSEHLFVNKEQVAEVSRPLPPIADHSRRERWNALLARAAEAGPLVQLQVPRPGLYGLRASDFSDAGVNAATIRADRLRAFLADREIPLFPIVEPRGNAGFTGDALFAIHVPDEGFERMPYRTIWLLQAGGDQPPLRGTLESPTPARTENTTPWRVERTVTLGGPNEYDHNMPLAGPQLRWTTARLAPGSTHEEEFLVTGIDDQSTGSIVAWFGIPPQQPFRDVEVYLNGSLLGTRLVQGRGAFEYRLDVPAGVLRNGANRFAVRAATGGDTAPGELVFLLGKLRYRCASLELPMQETATALPAGNAGAGRIAFAIPGKANTEFAILAARGAEGPTRLFRTTAREEGGRRIFSFPAPSGIAGDVQVTVALNSALIVPPVVKQVELPRSWRERRPVDWLAIVAPQYADPMHPLLVHREAAGLSTDLLTVDDIYNAFSYGEKSYRAIQAAIGHALRERGAPRLRSVLLVGEGSEYWWERRLPTNPAVAQDQLPVFGWADPAVDIRGDDSYARVVGEGPAADVEVGRFSVAEVAQLERVIKKTIDYETNPPQGPWLSRNLIVTDDDADFAPVARAVFSETLREGSTVERLFLQEQPYTDYIRIRDRKRSTILTDRTIDALNDGVHTVAYLGHGGPNIWAGERIFHNRDIERIRHGGRAAIMVVASCDTAWIDYPTAPVMTSLGENFFRSPDGGVLAIWAPIAGTSSYEHRFLLTRFYSGLHRLGMETLGELSLYSKLGYLMDRNQSPVVNQYLLLGDPATKVAAPSSTLRARLSRQSVPTTDGGSVTVDGEMDAVRWGTVEVELLDRERDRIGQIERAPIVDGRFTAKLSLPQRLDAGAYRIAVRGHEQSGGKYAATELPLRAVPPTAKVEWIAEGASLLREAGTEQPLVLRVENASTTESLSGVTLLVRERGRSESLAQQPIALAPGANTEARSTAKLPEGTRLLDAVLVPTAQSAAATPLELAKASILLRGKGDAVGLVVPEYATAVRRSPGSGAMNLEVPLHNLRAESTGPLRATLYSETETTKTLGLATLAPPLASGESATLSFPVNPPLPSGPLRLRLLVEDQESSATLSLPFQLAIPRGGDLAIVAGSLRTDRLAYPAGTTVFLAAEVENVGDEVVAATATRLYVKEPWVEGNAADSPVTSFEGAPTRALFPGDRATARWRYDPLGAVPGTVRLAAAIVPAGNATDPDFSNNAATIDVVFSAQPNLSVDGERPGPARLLLPGDSIPFRVPFRNTEDSAPFAREFNVVVTAEGPTVAPRRILSQRVERLPGGASGSVEGRWVVQAGEDRLHFFVNEDRDYPEATLVDNEATLLFDYLATRELLGAPDKPWDFVALTPFGKTANIVHWPDRSLTVADRPKDDGERLAFAHRFVNGTDIVPGGRFSSMTDNRFTLLEGSGSLIAFPNETAAPVSLRWPLADTGTNLYDVYLVQRGRREGDRFPSANFRYRIEGGDWVDILSAPEGELPLGRIETRDNYLDLTLAGGAVPSLIDFLGVRVVPVRGVYSSPVILAEDFEARFLLAETETPAGTDIRFDVRWGRGARDAATWGEWLPLGANGRIPPSEVGAEFFQWRVSLFARGSQSPRLRSVRFSVDAVSVDTAGIHPANTKR